MQGLISVVVPVYNVEKYIDKCVESIVRQTYSNLEILLIDDGSTDNSNKKCDDWVTLDKRILAVHKENGGLSSARNKGIEIAHGSKIIFIDSDDYIEENMISILAQNMEMYSAQISACGYDMVYDDRIIPIMEGQDVKLYNKDTVFDVLLHRDNLGVIACNKLYNIDLFEGVRYPMGKHFEDISTTYKLLAKADSIVYIPQVLYHYIQRSDSINGNNFKKKVFNATIYDMKFAADELLAYVERYRPASLAPISIGCLDYYLRVINQEILFDCFSIEFVEEIKILGKKYMHSILSAEYLSMKKKLQYCTFVYAFPCYKVIIKEIRGRK